MIIFSTFYLKNLQKIAYFSMPKNSHILKVQRFDYSYTKNFWIEKIFFLFLKVSRTNYEKKLFLCKPPFTNKLFIIIYNLNLNKTKKGTSETWKSTSSVVNRWEEASLDANSNTRLERRRSTANIGCSEAIRSMEVLDFHRRHKNKHAVQKVSLLKHASFFFININIYKLNVKLNIV